MGQSPVGTSGRFRLVGVVVFVAGTVLLGLAGLSVGPLWLRLVFVVAGAALVGRAWWLAWPDSAPRVEGSAYPSPTAAPPGPTAAYVPVWLRQGCLVVLAAVGGLVIVILLVNVVASEAGTPWPEAATREKVMRPVVAKLRSCAEAAVVEPANCPQRAQSLASEDVSAVRWELHGDPAKGAKIDYWSGTFDVTGHTVMTLRYVGDIPRLEVTKVDYHAEVAWNGGRPEVRLLEASGGAGSIQRRRPAVSDEAIKDAVQAAFDRCVAVRKEQQPPECPVQAYTFVYNATWFEWSLDGDPLRNSRITFDRSYGIFHVVGSYAMTLRYGGEGWDMPPEPFNGTYEAQLTVDGKELTVDGKELTVLRIESVS